MRLPTNRTYKKYEGKKKKESEQKIYTGKNQDKREALVKKVNKNYMMDYTDEYNKASKIELNIKKLQCRHVRDYSLTGILLDNEYIDISESWIGFICLMIETLYNRVQTYDKLKSELIKYSIITNNINIDKNYGLLHRDSLNHMVYRLENIGVYLDIANEPKLIYETVVLLVQALEIDLKSIKVNIKNNEIKEDEIGEYREGITGEREYTDYECLTLEEIKDNKKAIQVVKISSMGLTEVHKIHRYSILAFIVCKWIYKNLGYESLLEKEKSLKEKTGTYLTTQDIDTNSLEKITNEQEKQDIYIYSKDRASEDIKFIHELLKITPELKNKIEVYINKSKKL